MHCRHSREQSKAFSILSRNLCSSGKRQCLVMLSVLKKNKADMGEVKKVQGWVLF